MRKWLVPGLLVLAVVWGPWVYSQLTSSPIRANGKGRNSFSLPFGNDEEELPATEAVEPEPPAAPVAEAKPEVEAKAEPAATAAAAKLAKPVEAPAAAEGEPAVPSEEEPAPTLPSELVPAFKKVLETEPRDAFWANDEELQVHALFKAAGAAPDMLSEVACRTTVCRAVFIPDELDNEALAKLYTSLRTRYADSLTLESKPGAVGERATLYVLRPGYKLEH